MPIIDSLAFYLVAIPAVLIVGIGKGGFAGGLGVVAVPLMALTISPVQAAGIMLPILCVMDIAGVRAWLRRWDPAMMKRLMPPAILGIAIGALTFQFVNDIFMKWLIGLLALAFSLNYFLKGRIRLPWRVRDGVSAWVWSGMSGYTSFVAHAGGPPLMVYLLPKGMDKSIMVGTVTMYFAVVNYVKLIPYAYLGQLNLSNLLTSLVLAPLAIIGVQLGVWLHDKVNAAAFVRLMYGFLFLTGLKLTWDAASNLWA